MLPDRARASATAAPEPLFSRAEAMRTRAFWLISLYSILVYPVQAGVSLHQAPHLIERGLSALAAASVIGVFSAMSAVASIGIGFLPRRWPVRYGLCAAAILQSVGAFGLIGVCLVEDGYRFIPTASDIGLLRDAARECIGERKAYLASRPNRA